MADKPQDKGVDAKNKHTHIPVHSQQSTMGRSTTRPQGGEDRTMRLGMLRQRREELHKPIRDAVRGTGIPTDNPEFLIEMDVTPWQYIVHTPAGRTAATSSEQHRQAFEHAVPDLVSTAGRSGPLHRRPYEHMHYQVNTLPTPDITTTTGPMPTKDVDQVPEIDAT